MWHFLSKNLHVCVYEHLCRSRKTNYRSCPSPSTMYVLGWSSGRLAWQRRPLPPDPSCQCYCDIFTPAQSHAVLPFVHFDPGCPPPSIPSPPLDCTLALLIPFLLSCPASLFVFLSLTPSPSPPDAKLLYSEISLSVSVCHVRYLFSCGWCRGWVGSEAVVLMCTCFSAALTWLLEHTQAELYDRCNFSF